MIQARQRIARLLSSTGYASGTGPVAGGPYTTLGALLEGLRVAAEDAVEQAAHQHLHHQRLELVGDEELHVAASGSVGEAPSVLHVAERPARILGHAARVHLQRGGVQHHAAREALAHGLVAHRHLADQDRLVALAPALPDGQGLAQRQELGVALHVRHQIEHLARGEGHAAGGAEARHDGACNTSRRRQPVKETRSIAIAPEHDGLQMSAVLGQHGDDLRPALGVELPDVAQEFQIDLLRAARRQVLAHAAVGGERPATYARRRPTRRG